MALVANERQRVGTAYNVGDIGNYLFGRGMAELGLSLTDAKAGAHYNDIFFGRRQKAALYDFGPGTYGSPGFWDSDGDQRAIDAGFRNSEAGQQFLLKRKKKIERGKKLWKKQKRKYPTGLKI